KKNVLVVCSYEAPEDKEDVFARRACPAFLSFTNAAYLAGVTVELPCHCKPPQVHSVVWFHKKHWGGSEDTRLLSDHHGNKLLDSSRVPHSGDLRSRFSIRLFSLLIFRAGPDDSGVYLCGSAHRDFFYGYDLDIQEAHTLPADGPGAPQPLYRFFTSYRRWSVCDRCGEPGEQVRAGLCYVHSRFLHVRYRRTNHTAASCGSGAVPRAFGLSRLGSRGGAEMEVRRCQVKCPPQPPPSPKLLALMAFLGYSSSSRPAEVPVYYLNHPAERVLTLGCPGARPNLAVAWDRESEPIYRSEHHVLGRNVSGAPPRLLIDMGHHLVFTPAKTEDSGVYYCWLQGRRTAEIRLLVYVRLGRGQSVTSHPDFLLALRMVLAAYSVMTAVFTLLVLLRAPCCPLFQGFI
uniref:Family with sequence similarity 187 member A n=1 Tax=Myripristis murdjan TaxID=586833 RepID=A0A667Y936_9TELE